MSYVCFILNSVMTFKLIMDLNNPFINKPNYFAYAVCIFINWLAVILNGLAILGSF